MEPETLEERATSLAAGYRVQTHGRQAASLYRQAADAYDAKGTFQDRYRARRCRDNAVWCERNETSAAPC